MQTAVWSTACHEGGAMANFVISGTEELFSLMDRVSEFPDDVVEEALAAMAETAAEKIRESGRSMGVYDPKSNVHILDNIAVSKPKRTDDGGSATVYFKGTRRSSENAWASTRRNAEIAFINEYGTTDQNARPFIRSAIEKNGDEISDKGGDILIKWLEDSFGK